MTILGGSSTVYVVDHDPVVRGEVCRVLERSGYTVSVFTNATSFFEAVAPGSHGCLVADLPLSDLGNGSLQGELARRGYTMPLLLLTAPADVSAAVMALKAGASDVLARPVDGPTLLEHVAQLIREDDARRADTDATRQLLASLTQREREVLALVVSGLSNKEIGERLGISFRTVEVHRKHLMLKTHAANLLDLAKLVDRARRDHLISE